MVKDRGDVVPHCPVCAKPLYASQIAKLVVCLCSACGTTVSIPIESWEKAKATRKDLSGAA